MFKISPLSQHTVNKTFCIIKYGDRETLDTSVCLAFFLFVAFCIQ